MSIHKPTLPDSSTESENFITSINAFPDINDWENQLKQLELSILSLQARIKEAGPWALTSDDMRQAINDGEEKRSSEISVTDIMKDGTSSAIARLKEGATNIIVKNFANVLSAQRTFAVLAEAFVAINIKY